MLYKRLVRLTALSALPIVFGVISSARADSVAQVQTAKQITRETIVIIDPQGGGSVGSGSDVAVSPGDILTFRIRFTPVPNGATRGLGGYITDYIPQNTEVVGARIVDSQGNTVPPHRGGFGQDGVGPRNAANYPDPLSEGSISQVYADTGIFFSVDPLTARFPSDQFITVDNGIPMTTASVVNVNGFNVNLDTPTGAGQLDGLLGVAGAVHAHNLWDAIEAAAWGGGKNIFVNDGTQLRSFSNGGTGNSAFGYGSAVAGPDTFYPFQSDVTGANQIELLDTVGPWQRIKTPGAEVGSNPIDAGDDANGVALSNGRVPTRVGVAADNIGFDLSPTNPLPSVANPDANGQFTRAVRFAVGELVVGDEYFAEISLRVLDTPLDPIQGEDINCAEVFGGDASAFDSGSGGKDNTWRYFVPSPSCVQLNLFFELAVDKLVALSGDTLTYRIEGKNLSVNPQNNVSITFELGAGSNFVSATNGGIFANGVVTWPTTNLQPGDEYLFEVQATAGGNAASLAKATYTSTQVPTPGFSVVALTDVKAMVVMDQRLSANPGEVNAGGSVHYTGVVNNRGTGTLSFAGCNNPSCAITVTLPAGFAYQANSALANGAATANPTINGTTLSFAGPFANVLAGQQLTLEFDATVDPATAPGLYTSNIQVFARDASFGRQIEGAAANTAGVVVGIIRSDAPVITAPVLAGASAVSGTTTEGNGATIRLFVNDVLRGTATAAGGNWTVSGLPTLFAGQVLRATATASTEFESLLSTPVFVSAVGGATACNDGIDNDLDGLVDFPADPGCDDSNDLDEQDLSACGDGIDNDGDGLIDFPDDTSCSSFIDDDEAGAPACADGIDNDGDGLIDFPQDTGCQNAQDTTEENLSACSDGIDNDGDGDADFPFDVDCQNAQDDSESPNAATLCSDNIDNDNDGLIDFPEDPGCQNAQDNTEDNAAPQCSDGIDNDNDGLVDFPADLGCQDSTDNNELDPPQQACNDGLDNDDDGFIDFPEDPGCQDEADIDESNGNQLDGAGCGCQVAGNSSPVLPIFVMFLSGIGLAWRRRRLQ
jgi:uncharacterized repeat protein (TIGR01451 family)/MYXO-CTERM domain-containing protein